MVEVGVDDPDIVVDGDAVGLFDKVRSRVKLFVLVRLLDVLGVMLGRVMDCVGVVVEVGGGESDLDELRVGRVRLGIDSDNDETVTVTSVRLALTSIVPLRVRDKVRVPPENECDREPLDGEGDSVGDDVRDLVLVGLVAVKEWLDVAVPSRVPVLPDPLIVR